MKNDVFQNVRLSRLINPQGIFGPHYRLSIYKFRAMGIFSSFLGAFKDFHGEITGLGNKIFSTRKIDNDGVPAQETLIRPPHIEPELVVGSDFSDTKNAIIFTLNGVRADDPLDLHDKIRSAIAGKLGQPADYTMELYGAKFESLKFRALCKNNHHNNFDFMLREEFQWEATVLNADQSSALFDGFSQGVDFTSHVSKGEIFKPLSLGENKAHLHLAKRFDAASNEKNLEGGHVVDYTNARIEKIILRPNTLQTYWIGDSTKDHPEGARLVLSRDEEQDYQRYAAEGRRNKYLEQRGMYHLSDLYI